MEVMKLIYLSTCVYSFVLVGVLLSGHTNLLGINKKYMTLTAASLGFWSLGNALTYYIHMDRLALTIHEIKFLGIVYLPSFLLFFIVSYFNDENHWILKFKNYFYVVPTLMLLLVWTNPVHHFFRTSIERVGIHIVTVNGPAFWVHTYYSYALIVMGLIFLIRVIAREADIYKRKPLFFLLGILLGFVFNVAYVFFFYQKFPADFTPTTFVIAISIMIYAVWLQKPYRIVRVTNRFVLNQMKDGILVIDRNGIVMDINLTASRILGKRKGALIGHESNQVISGIFKAIMNTPIGEKNAETVELKFLGANHIFEIDDQAVYDHEHRFLARLIVLKNVTAIKEAANRVIYQSTHDSLTGLHNRVAFDKALESWKGNENIPLGMISLDVNGLGYINQRYGQEKGDHCLCRAAKIIEMVAPEGALVGRIGGDCFAIAIKNTSECEIKEVINQLLCEIGSDASNLEEGEIYIQMGIGYSMRLFEDESIEILKKEAIQNMQRKKMLDDTSFRSGILAILRTTLVERNVEDYNHLNRTQHLVKLLGAELGVPDNMQDDLSLLALLHDIGKLTIPDAILYKPAQLTTEEWDIMRQHPQRGYQIAESNREISYMARSILHHHERWDGTGYPNGLKGEEIPQLSRIISVVDAFDAMTYDRVYQKARSKKDAMEELIRCSGTQFDPNIVKSFEKIYEMEYDE